MCMDAQDQKIELVKQLETVLQGKVKPSMGFWLEAWSQAEHESKVMTQCCIVELYKLGKERQPAVDLAKTFERRKCNHREAIESAECISNVVGRWLFAIFHFILLTDIIMQETIINIAMWSPHSRKHSVQSYEVYQQCRSSILTRLSWYWNLLVTRLYE